MVSYDLVHSAPYTISAGRGFVDFFTHDYGQPGMDAVFVRHIAQHEMAGAGSVVVFVQVAQAAVPVKSIFVCKHIN